MVVGDFWTINSMTWWFAMFMFTNKTRRIEFGLSPLPGCQSPPGLWTIFSRESQPKPSFPQLLGGGTTQNWKIFVPAFDQQWAIHCDIGRNELRLKGKRISLETSSFWNHPPTQHISKRRVCNYIIIYIYIHIQNIYIYNIYSNHIYVIHIYIYVAIQHHFF